MNKSNRSALSEKFKEYGYNLVKDTTLASLASKYGIPQAVPEPLNTPQQRVQQTSNESSLRLSPAELFDFLRPHFDGKELVLQCQYSNELPHIHLALDGGLQGNITFSPTLAAKLAQYLMEIDGGRT